MQSLRRVLPICAGLILVAILSVAWAGAGPLPQGEQPNANTTRIIVSEDTAISAYQPAKNFGQAWTISVRSNDVASALFKFDLSSLPANIAVAQAKLGVYVLSRSNSSTMSASAYAINRPWVTNEATWQRAAANVPWAVTGCNGVPDDRQGEAAGVSEFNLVGGWLYVDVTRIVDGWLRGTQPNEGIILKGLGGSSVEYSLIAKDHSDRAHWPFLEVSYVFNPTPLPTYTALPTYTPIPTVPPTPTPYAPVLVVEKTGPPGPLGQEETMVTYQIYVRNAGTREATGLAITDTLPLGTVYRSCTADGVFDPENQQVLWRLAALAPGEVFSATLELDLASWVRELGTIVNWVRVSCAELEGVAEGYWQTFVVAPTPTATETPIPTATPTVTPSPTPYRLFLVKVYNQVRPPQIWRLYLVKVDKGFLVPAR